MQQKTKQGPNAPPQMLPIADNPQKEEPTKGMTASLKEESAADDHATQQVMGTVVVEDTHYLHKLHLVHKALFFVILAVLGFFAVMVFVITLFFLIVVRTFFLRFFKGDETIHNVDENKDAVGSIVRVEEEIHPYKEGRVHYGGTTWQARSDDTLFRNSNAIIIGFDGNTILVKSIEE